MADLNEGEIIFNGKSSLYDFGLKFEEYPVIPSINEEYETTKVEGRDGVLHINSGTYPNREITIKFDILSNDYDYDFDLADEWLSNIEDNRLFIGRLDRCFRVIKVVKGDTQKEFRSIGNITVQFICEPYRYDPEETVLEFNITKTAYTSNTITISNEGHFPIKPTIQIYGHDDMILHTGFSNTIILGVDTSTTLDSELQESTCNTYGDFPVLGKGTNEIYFSFQIQPAYMGYSGDWTIGDATKIVITYSNLYR